MTSIESPRSLSDAGRIGNPSHGWRTCWLVFERPPHPEAVSFPANEADVRLVLDLLRLPRARRADLAVQFRNYLAGESSRAAFDRRLVPVRHGDRHLRLVPWRLAKWLACVLPAADGVVERTARRLEHWLAESGESQPIDPVAQPIR